MCALKPHPMVHKQITQHFFLCPCFVSLSQRREFSQRTSHTNVIHNKPFCSCFCCQRPNLKTVHSIHKQQTQLFWSCCVFRKGPNHNHSQYAHTTYTTNFFLPCSVSLFELHDLDYYITTSSTIQSRPFRPRPVSTSAPQAWPTRNKRKPDTQQSFLSMFCLVLTGDDPYQYTRAIFQTPLKVDSSS